MCEWDSIRPSLSHIVIIFFSWEKVATSTFKCSKTRENQIMCQRIPVILREHTITYNASYANRMVSSLCKKKMNSTCNQNNFFIFIIIFYYIFVVFESLLVLNWSYWSLNTLFFVQKLAKFLWKYTGTRRQFPLFSITIKSFCHIYQEHCCLTFNVNYCRNDWP